jgi:adenylate kinase family enzyme
VIGPSGAGKTTVALFLAQALDLPVVHLDRLFWGPGWAAVSTDVFEARQRAAVSDDAWVIDGSYLASPGWKDRLRRADVILLVRAPLPTCLWRIVRRAFARSSSRRLDLPDGCDEHLSLYHLWWTLGWPIRHRGLIEDLHSLNPEARLVALRSSDDPRTLERLMAQLT